MPEPLSPTTGFGRNDAVSDPGAVAFTSVETLALPFDPIQDFVPVSQIAAIENILVVITVPALVLTHRRFPLSDVSYILLTLFLMLHAVGAHYTYAEVPFGFWLQSACGFARNHFDRIVHFSFGLLVAYPIREAFLRLVTARGFWAYYFPLDVTLAFSGLYEILEMIVARTVSPQAGDAYLGTQGGSEEHTSELQSH